jgi:hypothetical protein
MHTVFRFGEQVAGHSVNVLNEREVRAGAGILFLFAMVAFMNAWLTGNFAPTRIFVIAFLIDFAIRVLVNPRYAPSLVLGRFMVRKHAPEFVGATQKRFAWSVGLILALAMLYLVVIERVIGPINLIICATCLLLMFFESAFGICVACKLYNLFHRDRAELCPGGTCEAPVRHDIQRIGPTQVVVLVAFLAVMAGVARHFTSEPAFASQADSPPSATAAETAADPDCTPPDWAVKIGHAEMWKLHHNCQ